MLKINDIRMCNFTTINSSNGVSRTNCKSAINNEVLKYYVEEKINKFLENPNLKEGFYKGKESQIDYVCYFNENSEMGGFEDLCEDICSDFYAQHRDMDCNYEEYSLFICDCELDEKHTIIVMKIVLKVTYKQCFDKEETYVEKVFSLPTSKSTPNEGFIINLDDKSISILERKVKYIDGDKGLYISENIFRSVLELNRSLKETMKFLYKAVEKVNKENKIYDIDTRPVINDVIYKNEDVDGIKISDLLNEVYKDYGAYQETVTILNDLGIHEEDKIPYIDFSKLAKVKLKLDDDQIIEMSVEDYVNRDTGVLEIKDGLYGRKTVIINNINTVEVKK